MSCKAALNEEPGRSCSAARAIEKRGEACSSACFASVTLTLSTPCLARLSAVLDSSCLCLALSAFNEFVRAFLFKLLTCQHEHSVSAAQEAVRRTVFYCHPNG
eukprot:1355961-Rhodomonas_salina.1